MTAQTPLSAPDDLAGLVAESRWALSKALIPRGEMRHLRTCLARHVNSQVVPCAPDCVRAQKALALLVGAG